MADPLDTAARLLSPGFASVCGARDSDPVVRVSDHADVQANGALNVARRLGRNPRQVAEEIVAMADAGRVATFEVAGAGFINIDYSAPNVAKEMHQLALRLLAYDGAIRETLERCAPHRLCAYLFDLARDFTAFYENNPVLTAADEIRSSRLALAGLTARVLAHGLSNLGIDAPNRM